MEEQKLRKEELLEEIALALKDVLVGIIERNEEGVTIRLGVQKYTLRLTED